MENLQLDKSDYQVLLKNLLILSTLYFSTGRRNYISKWGLVLSSNMLTLQTIQQCLNYFKKLQSEAEKNNFNKNAELLSNVINILEKYNKE